MGCILHVYVTFIYVLDSVTSVGDCAFVDCSNLKYVGYEGLSVPRCGSYLFSGVSGE